MAAQAKHSCMPGTSEGDQEIMLIFSSTILTCLFEVKCPQLLLSTIKKFNFYLIMESESRENTKSFNVTCKRHNFTGVIADNAMLACVKPGLNQKVSPKILINST